MKLFYSFIFMLFLCSSTYAQITGPVERVYASSQTNSAWGLGLGGITNPNYAIDNSSATASTISIGLALVAGGYQQTLTFADPVPANSTIHIKYSTLASLVNVAGYVIISAYDVNNNQVFTTSNVTIVGLIGGENVFDYSAYTNIPIKSVKLSLGSTVGIAVSANIYGSYYEKSSTNSTLSTSPIDVLYGTETTALLNAASGLSTVANPYNCMDADQSTAATLYATANVVAQQQLTGIFSGLYPANAYAHVLVENPAALLSLSILNGPVTIQLLNDGTLVQSSATSAANLLALQLLAGSSNKGWINLKSTAAFNQVKVLSNSSVVGVLPTLNVYEISRDYDALALPVQYTNELSGIYKNGNIDLTWTTGNEINNKQFDIMKSQDAVNWNVLKSIPSFYANGNGNGHTYSYTDNQPFSGTNYYKLIQYDLDGKSSTGKIISLNIENNNTNIKIYPNPTTDKVYIDKVPIGTNYRVLDLSGKIISSGITNSIPANISVTNANSGILFINLLDNKSNKIGTFKIIKSK